jgi:signal transduction histidine kinase
MRIDWRDGARGSVMLAGWGRFALLATVAVLSLIGIVLSSPGSNAAAGAPVPIALTQGRFAFSDSETPPGSGWAVQTFPSRKLRARAPTRYRDVETVWVRFSFDPGRFGSTPIALYVGSVEQNYGLYLNGRQLYRSEGAPFPESFGWNHPLYLPLPPAMLRHGENELMFRITARDPQPLVIGELQVAPDEVSRASYNWANFFVFIAPQVISGYLVIMIVTALTFWSKRRGEPIFGWLALAGAAWLLRNLHYFVQWPPFDQRLFWAATTDSIFLVLATTFAFAIRYFDLSHRRRLTWLLLGFCLAQVGLRHALVLLQHSELPSFLLAVPECAIFLTLFGRACIRHRQPGYWLMFCAIALAVSFGFYDLGRSIDVWPGVGVSVQPYGGLLIFAAFDVALTTRLQRALADVEDFNVTLEARVAEVSASLERSEAARAELQIAHAVDNERDRMMREIHDGIGSSLLTALANAKHRNESPDTIATLTRSLTDLRIGVDSLEPIGGDVVALLANLRHRMERELKGAGLAFVWRVDPCPPLEWLDPVGALHVLRILQEAIGNALGHSQADRVEVRCHADARDGRAGILITIADAGQGFDPATASRGKGLANMAARGEALDAAFWVDSAPGQGTELSIWLPLRK